MSWTKKVTNPVEVLEKGQEVEVQVLNIDPENEKISVGLKQLMQDPWLEVIKDLPVGAHVEVEIAKLVSFGAFARLMNGIEGLIHVSELSSDRVQKPEEVLKVGDKVMAKVINISPVDRKIGLSVREYHRDIEQGNLADYGKSGGSVDVNAAMRGAVPAGMIQAGRSLEDVAHELMMAVSRVEAAKAADRVEEAAKAAALEAETAQSEDAAAGETPVSGVEETPADDAARDAEPAE